MTPPDPDTNERWDAMEDEQVVKNRRETAARMRELARDGLLVDLDGAFATPDLADAA